MLTEQAFLSGLCSGCQSTFCKYILCIFGWPKYVMPKMKLLKIVKKRAGRTKMAFEAFKSQKFEEVYKIKIKIMQFYINYNRFLTSNGRYL